MGLLTSSLPLKHQLLTPKYQSLINLKKSLCSVNILNCKQSFFFFFVLFLFNCLSIWWIKLLISILLEVIFRKISLLLLHPRHINNSNKKKTNQTKITQNRNLYIGAQCPSCSVKHLSFTFLTLRNKPFTSSHLSLMSYSLSFQILAETKLFCSSNYLLVKGTVRKHSLR